MAPGYTATSLYAGTSNAHDVALDPSSNLYVADSGNNRVLKLQAAISGAILQSYNTNSPKLSGPTGVCLDSALSVYVVDTYNNRVVKFNNAGTQLLVIPSNATTPSLAGPWGCIVDSLGFIYISNNQYINKLNANGTHVAAFIGLSYSTQLALDSSNALYVADANNNRVVKMDSNTGTLLQTFTMPTPRQRLSLRLPVRCGSGPARRCVCGRFLTGSNLYVRSQRHCAQLTGYWS